MRHEVGDPRTIREAVISQMLGEFDGLLTRAEGLPKKIEEAEKRVAATVRILDEAGNRYRQAVTAFTNEAKTVLTDHLQHKAAEVVNITRNEQCAALEEVVRQLVHAKAALDAARRDVSPEPAAASRRKSAARLLGHGVTALLASALTALLFSAARHL